MAQESNIKPKKVLFVSTYMLPHLGGVEKHISELAKELELRGWEVHYLVSGVSFKSGDVIPARVTTVPSAYFLKKKETWRWIDHHKEWIKSFTIVHVHDVAWWFLPMRRKDPTFHFFLTIHGYESKHLPTIKQQVMRKVSRKLAHRVIEIGSFHQKWYKTSKPDLLSFGAARYRPFPLPEKRSAVFIGRFDTDTGVKEYLRLAKMLGPDIPVAFYGFGPLEKEVIKATKTHPWITFHGSSLDPEETLRHHQIAFVSRYLGMIEAMQVGRLVVAQWDSPIKRSYLSSFPPTASMIIGHTAEDLFTQLKKLLKDSDAQHKMVKDAQAWAIRQQWSTIADQYEELWGIVYPATEQEIKKARCSIVVTVKNDQHMIDYLFNDLEKQENPPSEVVLVDGGSTDGTWEKILLWKPAFPVKKIQRTGANISEGRNLAVKEAKYDILIFTDLGCPLHPYWIQSLLGMYLRPLPSYRPADPIVFGRTFMHAESDLQRVFGSYLLVDYSIPGMRIRSYPSTRSMLISRDRFNQIGGFREDLKVSEDYAFSKKADALHIPFEIAVEGHVFWIPPNSWEEYIKKIFQYARFDVIGMNLRISVLKIYLRYIILGTAYAIHWSIGLALLALYLVMILKKRSHHLQSNNKYVLFPTAQLVTDFTVMAGTIIGLIELGFGKAGAFQLQIRDRSEDT